MKTLFNLLFVWSLGSILNQAALGNEAKSPATPPLPQRIASGTVGTDEILFELLGSNQQLARLVAVSIFSDNPHYSHLPKMPKEIKGRVGDNIEALIALKPDLAILASYNREETVVQLRRAGIRLLMQKSFRSQRDIEENILEIGKTIGLPSQAQQLVEGMQNNLKSWAQSPQCSPKKLKFLQYSEYDTVPGDETIVNDVAQRLGYQNLAADLKLKGWVTLNQEVLVSLNPDLLLAAGEPEKAAEVIERIQKAPGWKELAAVKKGDILVIPDRELYSVSHHIMKLAKRLAQRRSCLK